MGAGEKRRKVSCCGYWIRCVVIYSGSVSWEGGSGRSLDGSKFG